MNAFNALILDKSHRMLVSETPASYKGYADYKAQMAKLGVILGEPIGVEPPSYVFLTDGDVDAPNGWRWVAMKDAPAAMPNDGYWKLYTQLVLGGYQPPARAIDVFSFGNTPPMAARLAHLVIKGKKRATSGDPVVSRKLGLTVPEAGLVSIVTDGFGIPLCCIETERVEFRRYKDVPVEVAIGEGEGDLSLGDWQQGHWNYFAEEAKSLGMSFDENSEVFTEWFRVLKVLGRN
jgi:uncharacterized protein YhfF